MVPTRAGSSGGLGAVLSWRPRWPPLPPAAVAARAADRTDLLEAAARRVAAGAQLWLAAGPDWLLLLATEPPWFPAACYLGWEGGLLLPTQLAPSVPADLLRAQVTGSLAEGAEGAEGAGGSGRLIAVLPDAVLVAPMPARPVDLAALRSAQP